MKNEELIDLQLSSYNNHDIDGFMKTYSDEIEIYSWGKSEPDILGKINMKEIYEKAFKNKNLKAKILNRIIIGNKVIDEEEVETEPGKKFKAIAIYEIDYNKIKKVTFID